MNSLHPLGTFLLTPTPRWVSKVWWTGTRHIVDTMNPTYLCFASLITGLPTHTRTDKLQCTAGIPDLHLLLDQKSRRYGIRLLLLPNDYPNKINFRATASQKLVGLGRVKALLMEILQTASRQEKDVGPSQFLPPSNISIPAGTKCTVATSHNKWLKNTCPCLVIYTEGSKSGTSCPSGWHITWLDGGSRTPIH